MAYCNQCGAELIEEAKFCSECGTPTSFTNKLTGFGQRLKYKARKSLNGIKESLDNQISEYINKLEQNDEVKIGSVKIPEGRRKGVKNALKQFQNKYFEENHTESASYEEWVEDLPKRMDEHNCIVCFKKWDKDTDHTIVVCPHCDSGGHRNHLANWIKSKKYCPLCREPVKFSEFVRIENSN